MNFVEHDGKVILSKKSKDGKKIVTKEIDINELLTLPIITNFFDKNLISRKIASAKIDDEDKKIEYLEIINDDNEILSFTSSDLELYFQKFLDKINEYRVKGFLNYIINCLSSKKIKKIDFSFDESNRKNHSKNYVLYSEEKEELLCLLSYTKEDIELIKIVISYIYGNKKSDVFDIYISDGIGKVRLMSKVFIDDIEINLNGLNVNKSLYDFLNKLYDNDRSQNIKRK